MNHCIVPNWNARHQRQEDGEGDQERNNIRSSQVIKQSSQSPCYVVPNPMCNYGIGEVMRWENGEKSLLHGELMKQQATWNRTGTDTLESIVHQAATFSNSTKLGIMGSRGKLGEDKIYMTPQNHEGIPSSSGIKVGSFSGGKMNSSSSSVVNKRVRSESEQFPCPAGRRINGFQVAENTWCAGASAAHFRRDNTADTAMITNWPSFDSNPTAARNTDDDSACQDCSENQDEEFGIKGESSRSQSSARRSRAAVVHNQSERRRRDRINEKMKALQKLVPHASKTDKASMLDEVIEYLKQLQSQVHMLSNARAIPQMVIPLGMQQLQMSCLLGRMGMVDVNNLTRNVPQSFPPLLHGASPPPSFVTPPTFTVPPALVSSVKTNVDATSNINTSITNFNDAYGTFLAQQSMNMDFFNKMAAALYQQQLTKPDISSSRSNNIQ